MWIGRIGIFLSVFKYFVFGYERGKRKGEGEKGKGGHTARLNL